MKAYNMSRNEKAISIDVESGTADNAAKQQLPLYPQMMESPQLRWAFVRKVYSILSVQLLLTVAVAATATVISVHPVSHFFLNTTPGFAVFIVSLFLPMLLLLPLHAYREHHPVNLVILSLYTVTVAFAVGVLCAYISGRVILQAAILTSVVVVSLTLYTFWAVKRGHDYSFLGPFLLSALLMLIAFSLMQILFPLGELSVMIYSFFASIIFCAFIVYDTNNLIKRFSYDDYIWASVALYLDVINLFLAILTGSTAADR